MRLTSGWRACILRIERVCLIVSGSITMREIKVRAMIASP
jgi:hypothetical protein